MQWVKKHIFDILVTFAFVAGIGFLAYPGVSDWWNSFHSSRAVMSYTEAISNLDTSEYDRIWEQGEEYNARLAETGPLWIMTDEQMQDYQNQLKVGDLEVIGSITIDKINVNLPLYLTTSESVLQVAVGHLEGTSLPVGGPSTHSVFSGHRGLPSARLFTDLDKLVAGDTFQLHVLNRTLTYQVDQIRIVEPTDLSDLQILEGQDLCTLVTCTPYGINTHRLLVRGHRVTNPHGDAKVTSDALQIESFIVAPVIAAPVLVLLLVGFLFSTRKRKLDLPQIYKQSGVADSYRTLPDVEYKLRRFRERFTPHNK